MKKVLPYLEHVWHKCQLFNQFFLRNCKHVLPWLCVTFSIQVGLLQQHELFSGYPASSCVCVFVFCTSVFSLEGVSPFSWPCITTAEESRSYEEEEEEKEERKKGMRWRHPNTCEVHYSTVKRVQWRANTAEDVQRVRGFLSWMCACLCMCGGLIL